MSKTKISVMLVALSMTAGCSPKYQVKLDSSPQGASVVCAGTKQGNTPVTINLYKDPKNPGFIDASGCSARWTSGANAAYPARLKISSEGETEYTVKRPDAPGIEKDERFAQKIKQKRQEKKFFSETDSSGKNHPSTMLCSYTGAEKTCL
ncbi:hypothetical protein [Rhodanobacter caeni]|uniref:Lipoprotein n=1 Tax=Rhodanobacter caeni TaxID=657654 RepID=A0ABN0U9U4_9GAMM